MNSVRMVILLSIVLGNRFSMSWLVLVPGIFIWDGILIMLAVRLL